MIETILVEGPLWKLKTSFTGVKTWKECYVSVVMKESTLHVPLRGSNNSNSSNNITVFLYQWSENYKPSLMSRRMPKHIVDLSKCMTTYYTVRQYSFVITSQVTTTKKDILIFSCNDEANFDEWITVMNNFTLKATDIAYNTRTNQAIASVGEEASSDDDDDASMRSSIDQNLSVMSNLMRRRRNKDRERATHENQSIQSEGQDSIEAKDDDTSDDYQSSTSESVAINQQRIPRSSSKTDRKDDDRLNDVIAHPKDAQTVFRYFRKNNVMAKVRTVWIFY